MEDHEQPGHDSFHISEWQVEFRILTTIHVFQLSIVGAQWQIALDFVHDLELCRVQIPVRIE